MEADSRRRYSRRLCSAIHCKQSKAKSPSVTFHRFPKDHHRRVEWIQSACDLRFLKINQNCNLYLSHYRICDKHFQPDDYVTGSKILKKSAVPRVHYEDESFHCFHHVAGNVDHDYCKKLVNRRVDECNKFPEGEVIVTNNVCDKENEAKNGNVPDDEVIVANNVCDKENEAKNGNVSDDEVIVTNNVCDKENVTKNKNVDYDYSKKLVNGSVGKSKKFLEDEVIVTNSLCNKENYSNNENTDHDYCKKIVNGSVGKCNKFPDDEVIVTNNVCDKENDSKNGNVPDDEVIVTNNVCNKENYSKSVDEPNSKLFHRFVDANEMLEDESLCSMPEINGDDTANLWQSLSDFIVADREFQKENDAHDDLPLIPAEPFLKEETAEINPSTERETSQKGMKKKKLRRRADSRKEARLSNCAQKKRIFITKKKIILKEFGYRDEDCTPRKQKMFQLLKDLKAACRRIKNDKCHLVQEMKKKVLEPISAALKENLSPLMIQLIQGELKNKKRNPKGRRWTSEEKSIAASFYKRAPRHYNFLRKLMCLPSKKTVLNHINRLPFEPGINNQIFDHLRKVTNAMNEGDKVCSLLFDEMAIKPSLWYNPKKDRIEGYENYGSLGRTCRVADHALVFMIRGIRKTYKMPVAFYLSCGTVPTTVLYQLIQEIIKELFATGLRVMATICDQGATNRAALKMLKEATCTMTGRSGPYFQVEGRRVYIIYDPPHLIKNTRNNFMKYDVQLQGKNKIAKWEYVRKFYFLDRGIARMAYKLTKDHINPIGRCKMRVKLAVQVLSYTLSAGIRTFVKLKKLPPEAIYTANFITLFDRLFDSFNGSTRFPKDKKVYRTSLHSKSAHWCLWREMKEILDLEKDNLIFFDRKTRKRIKPPCQQGWLDSINAVTGLFQDLHKEGLIYLNLRQLNQDPIENLFSVIRQHGAFNTNPTAIQFAAALKTSIINSMCSKSPTSNCENDEGEFLTELNAFFETSVQENINNDPNKILAGECITANVMHLNRSEKNEEKLVEHYSSERHSYSYISGYILKRLFDNKLKEKCSECVNRLTTQDFSVDTIFISEKEYRDATNCLTYPNRSLTNAVIDCAKILYDGQPKEILKQSFHQENLIQSMTKEMNEEVDWDFLCPTHHKEVIASISVSVCRIFLKSWCLRYRRAYQELQADKRQKSMQKKVEKLAEKRIAEKERQEKTAGEKIEMTKIFQKEIVGEKATGEETAEEKKKKTVDTKVTSAKTTDKKNVGKEIFQKKLEEQEVTEKNTEEEKIGEEEIFFNKLDGKLVTEKEIKKRKMTEDISSRQGMKKIIKKEKISEQLITEKTCRKKLFESNLKNQFAQEKVIATGKRKSVESVTQEKENKLRKVETDKSKSKKKAPSLRERLKKKFFN